MRSCRCKRLGGATGAVLAVAASAAILLGAMSSSAVPAHPDDKTILHVLNRVSFGPRPGDVARVREMGLESYIDQQLHPERIADTSMNARLNGLTTLTKSSREIADDYFIPAMRARVEAKKNAPTGNDASRDDSAKPERTPAQMEAQRKQREVVEELSEQKILRAAFSDRQLEEVMTDFWFNHFNVFAGKGVTQLYLTEYERDAIRPHVVRQVSRSARGHRDQPGDAVLSGQLGEHRSERTRSP